MPKYNLKIASGYKASMDTYESKLLLCTELAHKLIKLDTVYDVIEKLYREGDRDSHKERCFNSLAGLTVMTRYKF